MDYLIYFTLILLIYLTVEASNVTNKCRKCGRKLRYRHIDRFGTELKTCRNQCNLVRQRK